MVVPKIYYNGKVTDIINLWKTTFNIFYNYILLIKSSTKKYIVK